MALIAHFKLDGNTIDTVGTYSSNTPTAITYTNQGKIDGAAIFNGSSSTITLASTINLAGNANWTVSAWVKTGSTARQSVLSNSSGGPVANDICLEGGRAAYYHYNGTWLLKQGSIYINDDRWHHITWVNFTGNKMNIYVDGVLDLSQVDSTQSTGPVNQIGKNWTTNYFNGSIDDLRIYNDVLLDKITKLSFKRKLVGHWPLESNGNDISGNNKTLATINNGSYVDGKVGKGLQITSGQGSTTIAPSTLGMNLNACSWSVSMWVKPNRSLWDSLNERFSLFEMGSYYIANETSITIQRHNGSLNSIYMVVYTNQTQPYAGNLAFTNTDLDNWIFVCLTFDGENTIKLHTFAQESGYRTLTYTSGWNKAANPIRNNMFFGGYGWATSDWRSPIDDVKVHNYVLSDYDIKELSKAKILHYSFNSPYEESTTNIYPRTNNALAFTSAYNGTGYGFGSNTNMQQVIDNTLKTGFGSSITKVSRINSGESQRDYVAVDLASPLNSTRVVSFWYYGTFGTAITPYNNDGSAFLYYLDINGEWQGGATSISVPVSLNVWQKITIKIANRGSTAGTGWSWTILHSDNGLVTLANTEYWAFAEFQFEEKDYPTPYTTGTRNAIIRDISGLKNNGTISAISNSPRISLDSKLGSYSMYFNGGTPFITTGLTSFGGLTSCTVSFWRKNDTTIQSWLPFVGQSGTYYIMATSSGTGGFYHQNIGSSWEIFKDGVGQGVGVAATPFTDQNWHHYAIRGVNLSSWTAFKLSGYNGGSWDVEGYFDDVRIYANSLSNDDIKTLYEKRANLDNRGNFSIYNEINQTKYKPLIMNYTIWANGQSGSISPFTRYGENANNTRILEKDPWGKETVVWKSAPLTTTTSAGIYFNEFSIDNTKMYRASWWEKRVTNGSATACTYYAGLNGYGATNGVYNRLTGALNTNPYFWNTSALPTQAQLPLNTWVLIVAHIWPAGSGTGSNHSDSGRYRTNGTKAAINQDFVWHADSTTGRSRSITVYQANATDVVHLSVYPRMDIVDGTEPSLNELLLGHDSRNFDYTKLIGGAINKPMDIQSNLTYITELDEISGTQNSSASQEINNNGTLIINGEFSEVD